MTKQTKWGTLESEVNRLNRKAQAETYEKKGWADRATDVLTLKENSKAIAALKAKINRLREAHEYKNKKMDEQEATINQLKDDVMNTLRRWRAEVKQLKAQIKVKDNTIAQLEKRIDDWSKRYHSRAETDHQMQYIRGVTND